MRQALTRRYEKVAAGEGVRPDLILIDGGKGQMGVASEVLAELGPGHRDVRRRQRARAANRAWRSWSSRRPQPVHLRPDAPALHLIQEIRDEAHRFAITGHRARAPKPATPPGSRYRRGRPDPAAQNCWRPSAASTVCAMPRSKTCAVSKASTGISPNRYTIRCDSQRRRHALNIPNSLTWARIALIPFFVGIYYLPESVVGRRTKIWSPR